MSEMKKFSEEFLRQIDVHELLPQQEPFVMIGTITYFDEERTVTETTIAADNIFVDDGLFSASGLIENVAQTCAARIGFVNKYLQNAPDLKRGYLIWIARYSEYKPDVRLCWWQLSATGRVNGITGDVDLNVFNGYSDQWEEFLANELIP